MNDIFHLFELTSRPEPSLFYSRGSSSDPRLGEQVKFLPQDYATCNVVLLGCPQDEGVKRNGGRVGAAIAPRTIRDRLYRLVSLSNLKFFDLGDLLIDGTLEEIHDRHRRVIRQLIQDGKTVVSLGGGNDVSYPDVAGLYDGMNHQPILAFNIDSHFDVRPDQPRNSGTPYRMLLEENIVKGNHLVELGNQLHCNSKCHLDYLKSKYAMVLGLNEWRQSGIDNTISKILQQHSEITSIFWGIDMDVIKASDAPGVSAPSPIGLTAVEIINVAMIAGKETRTRLFEITEVNPLVDRDDQTSRLAAIVIWNFLANRIGPPLD